MKTKWSSRKKQAKEAYWRKLKRTVKTAMVEAITEGFTTLVTTGLKRLTHASKDGCKTFTSYGTTLLNVKRRVAVANLLYKV